MGNRRLFYTSSNNVLDRGVALSKQTPHSLEDKVLDALDLLDERDRDIVRMYYYERMTYQAIANELGMHSRQRAFQVVRQALERLRQALHWLGVVDETFE